VGRKIEESVDTAFLVGYDLSNDAWSDVSTEVPSHVYGHGHVHGDHDHDDLPAEVIVHEARAPEDVPWYQTPAHYAGIVAILRSLGARVYLSIQGDICGIVGASAEMEGVLVVEHMVIWGNHVEGVWGYSLVIDGLVCPHSTAVPAEAMPEEVAEAILTEDYMASVRAESGG